MDEAEAVDALTRLGLTTYEARAFVALLKLGTGTASEVSEVADVPRSQVYGAAEGLEERGLVEVQQTTPTRYRPVPLEEAREKLLRELKSEGERAFDYLTSVEGTHEDEQRRSEAVWTVTDEAAIAARVADLVAEAEDRIIYGVDDTAQVEPPVRDALADAAAAGIDVIAASDDEATVELLDAIEGVVAVSPTESAPGSGRVLVSDQTGVLLSVLGHESLTEGEGETAIWSADSAFAAVIVTLLEQWSETHLPAEI